MDYKAEDIKGWFFFEDDTKVLKKFECPFAKVEHTTFRLSVRILNFWAIAYYPRITVAKLHSFV